METMKWNKRFIYPTSTRALFEGERHYDVNAEKLPSVTTILQATQPEEKRLALEAWKMRVGEELATRTKDQAAERGTSMHSILEGYLLGQHHLDLTELGQNAHTMARQIIENGLKDLNEIWGSEITVHYPGLYAGATDLAGVFNGAESIVDFKQSNKPKRKEWITDYFLQLGAYAMAHNHVYGTKITQGVILMCTKDNLFQKFEVDGQEFINYQHDFLKRVDIYYKNKAK
jgi:genome maintenance exonuclease 1